MFFTTSNSTNVRSTNVMTTNMKPKPRPRPLAMKTNKTQAKQGNSVDRTVINSYANKNPSLFGTGKISSATQNSIRSTSVGRSNTGDMFSILKGLSTGCSSCGKSK